MFGQRCGAQIKEWTRHCFACGSSITPGTVSAGPVANQASRRRRIIFHSSRVSMPKVKTHHWAGVTLSMKNLFGVVPGIAYGWPKNVLHWKGIDRSILDINAAVPTDFVIADGIVGMEGNGPLNGSARNLGRIVLAEDPVAADFTCAQLMGINPQRVSHLAQAAEFLGNGAAERIIQLAEPLPRTVEPFAVLPEFAYLTRA